MQHRYIPGRVPGSRGERCGSERLDNVESSQAGDFPGQSKGSKNLEPAVLALLRGIQSQLWYRWWYRSSCGHDFDISQIASPVTGTPAQGVPTIW